MRAILPAGLWAVIRGSAVGAAPAQSVPANVRMDARNRLDSLLHAYGPTLKMQFYRDRDDPFEFGGFLRQGPALRVAVRAADHNVTPQNTIGIRAYPRLGQRIDIEDVRDPNGLALQLLRFSAHDFLHWCVDDASHVFAAYSFTLESGFPEEAIKIVLRSIPLVDESVGQMVSSPTSDCTESPSESAHVGCRRGA